MNEPSNTFKYRVATINDWAAVLAVLKEAAPEVPLSLDTDESQAKAKTEVVQCCRDGHTWVAIDATGAIVGFVLARPGGNGAITLPFIGVSASSRKQGIFSNLIEKLKAKRTSLVASVLPDNQSGMADHLIKRGFVPIGAKGNATEYQWTPNPRT